MRGMDDDLIELETRGATLRDEIGEELSDETPTVLRGVTRIRPSSTKKFIRARMDGEVEEEYDDGKDFIDDYISYDPPPRRVRKVILKVFRNPISCVMIILLMMALNLLIYNEDPMTYSEKEVRIHGFGRIYNYFFRQYPPTDEIFWICFKVFSLVLWMILGGLIGKYVIHDVLLRDWLKLGLFKEDMGSWTMMLFTCCFTIFLGSFVYNAIVSNHFHLKDGSDNSDYILVDYLGIHEKSFNLIAVITTIICYSITLLISVDVMFRSAQSDEKKSKKYGCNSHVVVSLQAKWHYWRKLIFLVSFLLKFCAVFLYLGYYYKYGWMIKEAGHFSWIETARCWICAFIVVFDLVQFMQDWDYPRFKKGNNNVQMLGCGGAKRGCKSKQCSSMKVTFNGKWVNYAPWFIMTLLNFNLFLNQYTYLPLDYMQIADEGGYIRNINGETDGIPISTLNGSRFLGEFVNAKSIVFEKSNLERIYFSNCNETTRFGDDVDGFYYDRQPPWCTLCVREVSLNRTTNETRNAFPFNYTVYVPNVVNVTKCYNVSSRFNIRYVEVEDKEKLISLLPVVIIFVVFYGIICISIYNNSKWRCLKRFRPAVRYDVTS